MQKITTRKKWSLIACFLSPMLIMACYFAYRNMAPFGNQSILTVDLGQQYIDFFAYLKHVIFYHPSGIFYSFSKAYGGEMFGTWAYYLTSPVNLLLLFIPIQHLPSGILLITLIKYGLSGLSFGYLLTKALNPNPYLTIMWSIIYALNGWIIANQLNVMWLDGMIWLPLIILGVNQVFANRNTQKLYPVALSLAIITNYYMAYMIMIFTVIYIIFKLTTKSLTRHRFKLILKQLIKKTLLSFGLTAWLTLPTWFALRQGKAHYNHYNFAFRFEYQPVKMVSKLFNGGLNFDQLPHGTPNIFVGSVALISVLIYFCNRQIKLRSRIGALLVTLFMLLSMCYQPLDWLWHGGQFPIWYPDRFSFIFCFWIIWLAAHAINGHYQLTWLPSTLITALISLAIVYVFINRASFSFFSPLNFMIGIIFILISFILLLYTHNGTRLFSVSLLCLSSMEMGLNAFNSLNNLTYISNSSYVKYTRLLSNNVKHVQARRPNSRIGKTFFRSKDDPFSNNYSGGDTFDSSLEYTTPRFMKRIGQPEGHGYVTYSNGTLLSDRLLGYQTYLTAPDRPRFKLLTHRPDVQNYPVTTKKDHVSIHQNRQALPLVFTTHRQALHIRPSHNPIVYQNRWYHAITGKKNVRLARTAFKARQMTNLSRYKNHLWTNNPLRTGTLTLKLDPHRHDADYLLIGKNINPKSVQITANGKSLLPDAPYNHPIILNLTSGISNRPVTIQIKLLKDHLKLKPFKLYRLNSQKLLRHGYSPQAHVTELSNRKVTGTVNCTKQRSTIGSSIPATKGWHLKIDGRSHPIKKVANEFIGARVQPGKHHFTLIYRPPFLLTGVIITSTVVIIEGLKWLLIRKNKKV